ncbi:MAG: UDP-2,3-diacylglucosamine diphosphatase [Marinilabiliales bacterium]|nr:UDP-2,3-diacylglucosamine diphosphatase [Marinilabiliales bacterium]
MDPKRTVELVVLSDLHLGTPGCHADELLKYLKSIRPRMLILNGDIIDIWQFKKRYFPKSHLKIVKHLLGLASDKCTVYYITGNHDEMFRRFSGMKIGRLKIVNDLKMELDGATTWIFHGDVFDVVMQHSKWLSKLGAVGYDALILLNRFVNWTLRMLDINIKPVSFSKKIKESVKGAVRYINDFEETVATAALHKNAETVICGHIHKPEIRQIRSGDRTVNYLNSGDWIENLSALEYHAGSWRLFQYREDFVEHPSEIDSEFEKSVDAEAKELFKNMLMEFQH